MNLNIGQAIEFSAYFDRFAHFAKKKKWESVLFMRYSSLKLLKKLLQNTHVRGNGKLIKSENRFKRFQLKSFERTSRPNGKSKRNSLRNSKISKVTQIFT